jgi:hypothetical protein
MTSTLRFNVRFASHIVESGGILVHPSGIRKFDPLRSRQKMEMTCRGAARGRFPHTPANQCDEVRAEKFKLARGLLDG